MEERHFAILRRHMVEVIEIYAELARQDLGKAALDERVLAAMGRVPRHAFVPASLARYAYADMPLPIGFDKTISQRFMVAVMTDLLVSAAAELCPPALIEQLRPGGRMVVPTGAWNDQHLTVVEKDVDGRAKLHHLMPVQFSQLETVR
jgi:protein-L-isoaspartate O-methyltransferase